MTGIVNLSLVPLRASDAESSEMYTQLLFGERVEVLEVRERWYFIRNLADQYEGWVDKKMICLLTHEEEQLFDKVIFKRVQVPLSFCSADTQNKIILPGGSLIPYYNNTQVQFGNRNIRVDHIDVFEKSATGEHIVNLAKQYLNMPYLWGGKSALGIDCSGLTQVVYSMCGIQILRDAKKQVDSGRVIDFLSEAEAGDLAFFENKEGRIIHVGILMSPQKIIHASGWVKIDNIDSQGIISTQTGEYSHKLRIIKRLI